MTRTGILFYCNANDRVGFGHLRRCLFLAKEIRTTNSLEIAFAGSFSEDAMMLIRDEVPAAKHVGDITEIAPEVVVIDYMFDPQDMEAYDWPLIAKVADRAERSLLLTSAATVPSELPVDIVIGHLLEPNQETSFELNAGLQYAPVAPELGKYRTEEANINKRIKRVFVGFGNWDDPSGVLHILQGLNEYGYSGHTDLLLPSALLRYADQFEDAAPGKELQLHHNIPSVPAMLVHADVAFTSYGSMTYEAMALGVPTIVLATKRFMTEYSLRLVDQNLASYGGHVNTLQDNNISNKLKKLTFYERKKMSHRCISKVNGEGLRNVAKKVLSQISNK